MSEWTPERVAEQLSNVRSKCTGALRKSQMVILDPERLIGLCDALEPQQAELEKARKAVEAARAYKRTPFVKTSDDLESALKAYDAARAGKQRELEQEPS